MNNVKVGQVYSLIDVDPYFDGRKYYVSNRICDDDTLMLISCYNGNPWSFENTFSNGKFELVKDVEEHIVENEFKYYTGGEPIGSMFVNKKNEACVAFVAAGTTTLYVCYLTTGVVKLIAHEPLKKIEHDGIVIKVVEKKITQLEVK